MKTHGNLPRAFFIPHSVVSCLGSSNDLEGSKKGNEDGKDVNAKPEEGGLIFDN